MVIYEEVMSSSFSMIVDVRTLQQRKSFKVAKFYSQFFVEMHVRDLIKTRKRNVEGHRCGAGVFGTLFPVFNKLQLATVIAHSVKKS